MDVTSLTTPCVVPDPGEGHVDGFTIRPDDRDDLIELRPMLSDASDSGAASLEKGTSLNNVAAW